MDECSVRPTEVARSAARTLEEAGIDSARVEAELICAHVAGVTRSSLLLVDGLDAAQVSEVERIVAARAQTREPLQYLLGRAVSGRLDLAVGPGVFIPRPETELLVESVLGALPAPGTGLRPIVVDLCAGSGTIALEIAHARPDVQVHAVELHEAALVWLRRNVAERIEEGDTSVEVHQADATDPALLSHLHGTVAAVVSNPPYIPQTDDLPPEVGMHEPPTALFGGSDGLVVIRPLVTLATNLLRPGGRLVIEHDDTTGAAVAAVVSDDGHFGTVGEHTDLAGRPRFVTATRNDDDDDDDGGDASIGEKGIAR